MVQLVQDFIIESAKRTPHASALSHRGVEFSYAHLAQQVLAAATALQTLGLVRAERVAVYLDKREETVIAMFGSAAAGAVFVPINPVLKPDQVTYILRDCNVRILVTSSERLSQLSTLLVACLDLHTVIVLGDDGDLPTIKGLQCILWRDCIGNEGKHIGDAGFGTELHGKQFGQDDLSCIDDDMAAILYTSGSTGKPKGVVLSHRNLVAGALSVASYLENQAQDRILCVLPLSFDYGLSQLTTAFSVGACAVLMNYLLVGDIIDCVASERITGLAAVPPLWIQLSQRNLSGAAKLRYITNSGGAMQRPTLAALRLALPHTRIYLMYGLTEAFRSTYLDPAELDARPTSIGKAIPNAQVLVLRPDGTPCAAGEPGELVHRGALVALGYWNDAGKTAERFKPLPAREPGLTLPEMAVWSGDTVRKDDDGYLYFIGRFDDMIKTSGYRVSPTEVEEVVYASALVAEAVAVGLPHPMLGQAIVLIATAADGTNLDAATLLAACKAALPGYMLPASVQVRAGPLPRNPNGKIDRKLLAGDLAHLFQDVAC
jgi:acyl-CoA ligase (AMP-forming) (exosortase A-associated)